MISSNFRFQQLSDHTPHKRYSQQSASKFGQLISIALLSLASALSQAGSGTDVDAKRIINADKEPGNWLSHGRTYDEQRFSPLNQINHKNIEQLGLAWSFEFDDARGLEATPIVVDGVIYSTAAWSKVYAHDAKTGTLLWKYDPMVPKARAAVGCCGPVNRGLAIWKDRLYVGTYDGYLVALDAKTGRKEWSVLTIDPNEDYTITGAPRVVKGNVIIGNGGAEFGVRGYVSAYDAKTGKMNWRFYTVPGDPKKGFENDTMAFAAGTWKGEWWKLGGGGTVWDSMAYDPALNLLYIGVGNGTPWNQELRSPGGGDNLFLSSIVALNPDTGEYVWHYQTTPGESWDYTATQQIVLADIEWQGEPRSVLMQAPKNGFFFIIDRKTGEFLSAEPFTEVNWASHYTKKGRPIENPGARYQEGTAILRPSALGSHNWHSMSYSPKTNLVYIPVIRSFMEYAEDEEFQPQKHHPNFGIETVGPSLLGPEFMQILKSKVLTGYLLAWDPINQKEKWRVNHKKTWNGGVLSSGGNLVFQGTADMKFKAFNARTGRELWRYTTSLGIIAAPVTYLVDGEQYVTVLAKSGGGVPLIMGLDPEQSLKNGRLLTFKLDGQATLPKPPPVAELKQPPPRLILTNERLEAGEKSYNRYCTACHGSHVVSGGNVPDLRHSSVGRHKAFESIVYDGILEGTGMVGFKDVLTKSQVQNIQAYVLEAANDEYEEYQERKASADWWLDMKLDMYNQLADWIVELSD